MKKCYCCNKVKPILNFCATKKAKGGRSNLCKACAAAKMREYRKRNPNSARKASRKHYEKHKESRKKRAREYYHDNSAKAKQTQKKYRQENAAVLNAKKSEWQRKHYQENKEQYREKERELLRRKPEIAVAKTARRKARILGNGGSFTAQEWIDLKKRFNHTCLRCRKKEPQIKLSVDHVVSLVHGGSSDISNIQPLCCSCNKSKQGRSQDFRHFPVCQLGMMA